VFALPAKGVELMGFDLVHPNRVVVVNIESCACSSASGVSGSSKEPSAGLSIRHGT